MAQRRRPRLGAWQHIRVWSCRFFRRAACPHWRSVCEHPSPRVALRRALADGTVGVVLLTDDGRRPRRVRGAMIGRRARGGRLCVLLALVVPRDDPAAAVWLLRRVAHYFPHIALRVTHPRYGALMARRAGYAPVPGQRSVWCRRPRDGGG